MKKLMFARAIETPPWSQPRLATRLWQVGGPAGSRPATKDVWPARRLAGRLAGRPAARLADHPPGRPQPASLCEIR